MNYLNHRGARGGYIMSLPGDQLQIRKETYGSFAASRCPHDTTKSSESIGHRELIQVETSVLQYRRTFPSKHKETPTRWLLLGHS